MFDIFVFFVLLGVLIAAHEFGHYSVARAFGIGVEEFAVGMGKKVVAWRSTSGETWSLRILPIGGFVRLFDANAYIPDRDSAWRAMPPADLARSFSYRPAWQRALVILGGPVASVALGALILFAAFVVYGGSSKEVRIAAVATGSVAEKAGLAPGDTLLTVNGRAILHITDVQTAIEGTGGQGISLELRPFGDTGAKHFELPSLPTAGDPLVALGARFENAPRVALPIAEAAASAIKATWKTCVELVRAIWRLVSGDGTLMDISGPVALAVTTSEYVNSDYLTFLVFAALLTINLGIINMLPIPILDGGQLVLCALEMVLGRRLPKRIHVSIMAFGGLCVLALLVLGVATDIVRYVI